MDYHVEAAAYEHETEFDRLYAAISWEQVEEYARKLHSSQGHLASTPKLRHCYAVSELASRYAKHVFVDMDFFAQRYNTLKCKVGGLLHESLDYGEYFEDLVKVADEGIARLVAAIATERRMPRPARLIRYSNQVGLSSAAAQVVKLADLQHDCFLLSGSDTEQAVLWAEEAKEVLACLGKISTVPELVQPLKKLKLDLQALDKQRKNRRT